MYCVNYTCTIAVYFDAWSLLVSLTDVAARDHSAERRSGKRTTGSDDSPTGSRAESVRPLQNPR